jgi:hypothetical protein
MKLTLVLAVALALAACNRPLALTVTEEGVGPLTAETPYEYDAIAALLPGWHVTTTFAPIEGEDYHFIAVLSERGPALEIASRERDAPTIYRITVLEPGIPDMNGVTVGTVYADIYETDAAPECLPGVEEHSGNLFCPASGTTRIYYELDGAWDGPDGTVPPRDVIADWKVIAIRWRASPV